MSNVSGAAYSTLTPMSLPAWSTPFLKIDQKGSLAWPWVTTSMRMFERSALLAPPPVVAPLALALGEAVLLHAAARIAITPSVAIRWSLMSGFPPPWTDDRAWPGDWPRPSPLDCLPLGRPVPRRSRSAPPSVRPAIGRSAVGNLLDSHRSVLVERTSGGLRDAEGLDAVALGARALLIARGDADEGGELSAVGIDEPIHELGPGRSRRWWDSGLDGMH